MSQENVEVVREIYMLSVWTFRDGKVVGLRFTPFREEALAAAGLSE